MVWGAFGWPGSEPEPEEKKSVDGTESDYPECDYDENLTPLYEAIEERAWIAINQFLHSGYWPESLFPDPMTPEEQARTWVTRYENREDGTKKVRWSQLPIHAAVIFGAPSVVIQQLVEAFPQSVRCTDDHRMLPLHLAFRHGSDDSVLALFLEEFPEAVNVRGYKGRLPVECAQKGPNPERGAIIQTILHKNQSAWERKKSAVQLKELYCIKEALKIKSQKVSHLETAIREIKSREHKTRKELAATMTDLKAAKSRKDDINAKETGTGNDDDTLEKETIKDLVQKLARLEMATKDLVDKESRTKLELQKTLAELESTKKLKPTDIQAEQFAKLDRVASTEPNMLKQTPSRASFSGEPVGREKAQESAVEVVAKKELQEFEDSNIAVEQKIASLKAQMKEYDDQASRTQESLDSASVAGQTEKQSEQIVELQVKMSALKENSAKAQQELELLLKQKAEISEKSKKLEKKIALLTLALKQFNEKSTLAQQEMNNIKETMSSDPTVKLTPSQERHLAILEAAIEKLQKNTKKTKKELEAALEEKKAHKKENNESSQEEKILSVEQTNKKLEEKISLLEETMKKFEDKATKTKADMKDAMISIKDSGSVKSSGDKMSKKQEKHMALLEASIKKLEKEASKTKSELDGAVGELSELKAADKKSESTEMKALSKKIQALQSAMLGYEVEEIRTLQDLEKAVKELEEASNKRYEVLSRTAEHSHVLASDSNFNREVSKLDRKADKEEKKVAELEGALKEMRQKIGISKEEVERTKKLVDEITKKVASRSDDLSKAEEEEQKQDKKTTKELSKISKKIAVLESAIVGFEVKANRIEKDLEEATKQLEELTSKRFEIFENAAAAKQREVEYQGAIAEEKVSKLQAAMNEMAQNAESTKMELESTKQELAVMQAGAAWGRDDAGRDFVQQQNNEIKELNEKIGALQQAVTGFEVKETKTMQELEQTMKQLEELTAKRFEVLQKVAGREIEAAKTAEAEKYEKRAAEDGKKVEALESAMRALESNAEKTRLDMDKALKVLEQFEEKQSAKQQEITGITKDEKRVMRELVSKVAEIQEAVMAYEEKEHKTTEELERTRSELGATKQEIESLRAKHDGAVSTYSAQEQIDQTGTRELGEQDEDEENHAASENAKRVTEETLTTLEEAISRLIQQLGTEDEAEQAAQGEELIRVVQHAASATNKGSVESQKEEPASATNKGSVESQKEEPEVASKAPVSTFRGAATNDSKPKKKNVSFFGMFSKSNRSVQKKVKIGFSMFGPPKKSVSKETTTTPKPMENKTENEVAASAAACKSVITDEQRNAVEAIHGTEITAVLTDEQILAILTKMENTPAEKQLKAPQVETVSSGASTKAKASVSNKSVAKDAESVAASSVKSSGKESIATSVKSSNKASGMSPSSNIPPVAKDAGSVAASSVKSSGKESIAPSVKSSNKASGMSPSSKISPAPVGDASASKGDTKSIGSSIADAKSEREVLVTARTYDDGFELNF